MLHNFTAFYSEYVIFEMLTGGDVIALITGSVVIFSFLIMLRARATIKESFKTMPVTIVLMAVVVLSFFLGVALPRGAVDLIRLITLVRTVMIIGIVSRMLMLTQANASKQTKE